MTQTFDRFKIIQLPLGPMANFVYIIIDNTTQESAIIDPGWDSKKILDAIVHENGIPTKILLTHGHFDHVNALEDVLASTSMPVFISRHEAPSLTPSVADLHKVDDNDIIELGALRIQCIHTPGHTPGGQCFLVDNALVTGDTLFVQGCGRCDLPNSDPDVMYTSLQKLKALDDHLHVFPGHHYGDRETALLGELKKTNRFLLTETHDDFIDIRMGGLM